MAFRADDVQPPRFADTGTKLDVRASSRHVGGDGDRTGISGVRDDFRLALVLLCVQHIVRNPFPLQHTADGFRDFNARGADKNGTVLRPHLLNFFDNGVVLFPLSFVDDIVHVITNHRLIRGDHDNIQLVDIEELSRFGLRCTRHARQLVVQPEVVLECDGGERLHVALDLHPFFRFDGLMKSVRIAAAGKYAAGKFINDLHLAVVGHNIFVITGVEGVRPQQLCDGMNAIAPLRVEAVQLVFLLLNLILAEA